MGRSFSFCLITQTMSNFLFLGVSANFLFLPVIDSKFHVVKFNYPNVPPLSLVALSNFGHGTFDLISLTINSWVDRIYEWWYNYLALLAWLVPYTPSPLSKQSFILNLTRFCCTRVHLRWDKPIKFRHLILHQLTKPICETVPIHLVPTKTREDL